MIYVKVRWIHNHASEPVMLYSELDKDMWETRKVEVYADGHADFADVDQRSGNTKLGIEPYPQLEQIAADPEFELAPISATEFESIWEEAKASNQV